MKNTNEKKRNVIPVKKENVVAFNNLKKQISKELNKVEGSYLSVAYSLYYIHSNKYFVISGCKNIYDFAKQEFGFSRGTCNNFINIVDRFSKRNENGEIVTELLDEMKGFKSSQLIALINIPLAEIGAMNILPTMSVRDIIKAVKGSKTISESKKSEKIAKDSSDTNNSSSDDSDDSVVDSTATELKRNVLITCKNIKDYEQKIDKIDQFIINAFNKEIDKQIKIEISYTWVE